MLHANEKYINSHSQLWKGTFWQKKIIWKARHDIRQLRKIPWISKIQESVGSEYLTECYLSRGVFLSPLFMFLSTLKDIKAQSKTNHWMFSLHFYVNATLKFLWALGGLSEGTQRAHGHSESTWRTLGRLRHSDTWALRATQALGHLRHSIHFI